MLSRPVNGTSHPPKKSVAISALAVIMLQYSEIGNSENFIALYSVWYPAMSSDSASGRSNGSRFVSARPEMRKTKNEKKSGRTYQVPACCDAMMLEKLTLPERSSTGIRLSPIATSYEIICALDRRPPRSAYL